MSKPIPYKPTHESLKLAITACGDQCNIRDILVMATTFDAYLLGSIYVRLDEDAEKDVFFSEIVTKSENADKSPVEGGHHE